MKELKKVDYALLSELMKDSHRSDRQLAKVLEISQPTVTRKRAMLEEHFIDGYTVIPKFGKIGFEIVAFTFTKNKFKHKKAQEKQEAIRKMKEWHMKQPNVILALDGQGIGWDGLCVSFHKNYSDFADFIRMHDSELSDLISESQTFHADVNPGVIIKPLHLKYLAKAKQTQPET